MRRKRAPPVSSDIQVSNGEQQARITLEFYRLKAGRNMLTRTVNVPWLDIRQDWRDSGAASASV
ncbi:hypothetical protein KCP75_23135 [Salmonella enterica subsp. enterica]|nr:hypothetical protein KCP75_23135 [Salmonella enterica subsp. enterica]